ncbi:selenite/tellurite reduction operon c-type cytochrome lipoprotein ExtS [Geomonas oryzae]|uniref:selenite/tellurite reduction operon c-type cytochrome lipoprotein ExtS n=1 Tax=Geomonas oryzae TaxID=2364273 RepID=UPI00100B882B|nr:selenite/tellurite reduction operon c-type cytochrome lipoprotein ExtS [Geomonas oryzae]
MAVRRPLLITLALLLCLCGAAQGAGISCLKCHRPHYQKLGKCVDCHRGDPRSDRARIAHHGLIQGRFAWFAVPGSAPLEKGRRLMDTFACRRCHTSAGDGNRLAGNLDRLPEGTTAQEISEAIRVPALMMPQFQFDEAQRAALVSAILAGARRAGVNGEKRGEPPQVVHFKREREEEDIFGKRCGPCHRALTATHGGLGRGSVAPNLSGLFTRYYPKTAPNGAAWEERSLKKWLENPRRERPFTPMRPVPLEPADLERLLTLLRDAQR